MAKGLYNVYLHPLSKFPGPRFAAATKIPIAAASWDGTLPHWLLSLHEQYSSEVIRISPDELSIISPGAWKDIYAHEPGRTPFPKDLGIYTGFNSIVTANDADHSRMRRVLSHTFSDKALREQEPLLQMHVQELIDGLRKASDSSLKGEVDIVRWFRWTTMDIIGDLAFGESFDCLKSTKFHSWVASLASSIKIVVMASITLRFPPLQKLLRLLLVSKSLRRAKDDHGRLSAETLERRMELGTSGERKDFMTYILAHNEAGKAGLTKQELHDNANTMIGAGSETTAGLLSGIIWFALKNPDCLARAQAEVREACKVKGDINAQVLGELEYFNAFINEVFRIYPTGVAGQPRRAPPEGAVVCGHYIPGGTGIQMNQFAVNHYPGNFSSPKAFAPERWLVDATNGGDSRWAGDKREVLQPFGIGPRNCIGKNLAFTELGLVFARMVWEFDVELGEEMMEGNGKGGDWADQRSWMTWSQPPLWVRLIPRWD